MKTPPHRISKTRMMKGFRCAKALYLDVFSRELGTQVSERQQALFDLGNRIGAEARKRFPGGTLIECEAWDYEGSLNKTKELIDNGNLVIFEAAFEYGGCYARADVFRFSVDTGKWTVYEVKSSTKVKPEHIEDAGFQAWIIKKSGIELDRIKLLHLNPNCRYPDLSNLFIEADITEELRAQYDSVEPRVSNIFQSLHEDDPPHVDIGPHCLEPHECDFRAYCWEEKNIPEVSIFDLPQIYDKQWGLYGRGILSIEDVPLRELNQSQHRAVAAHTTGVRFMHAPGIKHALKTWLFPLVFLDFETINPAIPRFDLCRPYDQVPFQFSAHMWKSFSDGPEHHTYLHKDGSDPRKSLIPALIAACGKAGSIVSYYGKFESDRIRELGEYDARHKDALLSLIPRIVDPLPVIRDNIYDPAFKGSFSLKSVAPALLGPEHGYSDMVIGDGGAAQRAFEEMIDDVTPGDRKIELEKALLSYCEKDTLVMLGLVQWLYRQAGMYP